MFYRDEFVRKCHQAQAIFDERNASYKNAFRTTGVTGAVSELIGCVSKLHGLVMQGDASETERIRNALLDAHNFANIGLMMLDEGNLKGISLEDYFREQER